MSVMVSYRARKTLSEQLDRLDARLDGLAEALTDTITDSVREAVQHVLTEVLTNPEVLARIHTSARKQATSSR